MTKYDKLIASHDSAHHHSVIRELWHLSGENGKLLVTCYGSELHKHVLSNLASVLQPRGPVVWWSVVRGRLPPAAYSLRTPARAPKQGAKRCKKVQKSAKLELHRRSTSVFGSVSLFNSQCSDAQNITLAKTFLGKEKVKKR